MKNAINESWTKISHVIPASQPRGYARGVRDLQTSRLKLHISQYIPHSTSKDSSKLAVTLILQHGMPPADNAACLEPFLSDLLRIVDVPVRSVWAMDIVSSGKSFLLNQDEIGDEHHWFDSARDILQMVNHFHHQMKPPIIGFGQSWGAQCLLVAASMSPLLFGGLVGSEPVVENGFHQAVERGMRNEKSTKSNIVAGLYKRRRVWNDLDEVKRWWTTGKGKYFGDQYDPRVLDKIIENDYYQREDGKVELVTPPSQSVTYFVRPDPPILGLSEDPGYKNRTEEMRFPDGFWSPWMSETREHMRKVQCNILYLWASENSKMTTAAYRKRLVGNTGTGICGGGGSQAGQIEEKELIGGHSLPLFVPTKTAEAVAPWIKKRWIKWQEEQERRKDEPAVGSKKLPAKFEARLLAMPSKL
ncbi:MAG: hypothetical protein Q9220_007303 [cf. Caloplaca sp. 1 TL-2023]